VREPLLQRRLADIGQFLVREPFQFLEHELVSTMGKPCRLQAAMRVGAQLHGKPEPVADRAEHPTHRPSVARQRTT
jgi:hypothetical protein